MSPLTPEPDVESACVIQSSLFTARTKMLFGRILKRSVTNHKPPPLWFVPPSLREFLQLKKSPYSMFPFSWRWCLLTRSFSCSHAVFQHLAEVRRKANPRQDMRITCFHLPLIYMPQRWNNPSFHAHGFFRWVVRARLWLGMRELGDFFFFFFQGELLMGDDCSLPLV